MVIGEKQSFAGERPAQSQWESRIHAIVLGRETPNDGGMSSTAQITIVFTDNDSDLKAALCAALEDAGADHVERCVRKGSWAAATFTPDVVVIDVNANLQRSLEQLTRAELDFPTARPPKASLQWGSEVQLRCILGGAGGFIERHATPDGPRRTLHESIQGRVHITFGLAGQILRAIKRRLGVELTPIEHQILMRLSTREMTSKTAAFAGIFENDVAFCVTSMSEKLDASRKHGTPWQACAGSVKCVH